MRTSKTYQYTILDFAEAFNNLNTTGQAQFYKDMDLPPGNIVQIDLLMTPNIINDGGTTNAIFDFKYFGAVGNATSEQIRQFDIEVFNSGQNNVYFQSMGKIYLWLFLNVSKGQTTDILILNTNSKVFIKFTFEV